MQDGDSRKDAGAVRVCDLQGVTVRLERGRLLGCYGVFLSYRVQLAGLQTKC